MFCSMPNTRLGLVAFSIIASAALSVNCGGCDDTNSGDLGIDGGGFGDGGGGGGADGVGGGSGTNNSYDGQTGVGHLTERVGQEKIDLLWVIDNSGSLCQEQRALRDHFSRFATQLANDGVDFNIAVTTTQMDDYPLEPLAQPGHIQSEPQPLPNPLPICHGDEGDPDDPTDGYQPIRDSIATAVGCTKDPSAWQHLLDVTDDELDCLFEDQNCGHREDFFPTKDADGNSPYREIPKVIRSTEYDAVNKVDIERLSKDFACMGMVGTSGQAIEKGLGAAVAAVSPELTGGAVENPADTSAPNHGLLREDAKFGLVFLTDENDCTHDGTLDMRTGCGSDICAIANHPDFPDSPLLDPSELSEEFVTNLSASKGRQVSLDEISIASIHGRWKRYGATPNYPEGDAPMNLEDDCDELIPDSLVEKTSCDAPLTGTAYSGDRYEAFARNFPRTYPPVPENPDEHMPGLICQPERIPETLEQIGQTAAPTSSRCITRDLYACDGADDAARCPSFRFGDGEPSCVREGDEGAVCDSAVELQIFAPDDADSPVAALEATGLCIPHTIDAVAFDSGCVVDRAHYELVDCPGGSLRYEWSDDQARADLAGFEIRVRYLTEAYSQD
jgi:hypothetical protein